MTSLPWASDTNYQFLPRILGIGDDTFNLTDTADTYENSYRASQLPQVFAAKWSVESRAFLNPIQRACNSGERIGFDAEALQERNEQAGERFFFYSDFAFPAGIGIDSGAFLVVFVAFAEFEIPAVGEAQVFSTGRDNRVIA